MIKFNPLTFGGVCFSVFLLSVTPLPAQSTLDETVSVLEQWVDMERRISENRSSWEADKASMENLISIYEQEIDMLEEQVEEAENFTSEAEKKRAEYSDRDKEVKTIEADVTKEIIVAEKEIKSLFPLLPLPLQQELQPLFNSLPDNPEESKVPIGSRIQPIVAILTQVQKFNQVVSIVEGFQEFEAGRTVQTETIYFGLGAAYYVDQANENAGIGVLTDSGWNWKVDNTLAPRLRNFVEIYRGSKQAEYVKLPVELN